MYIKPDHQAIEKHPLKHNTPIKSKHKRSFVAAGFFLVFLSLLGYLVYKVPPGYMIQLLSIGIPILYVFFFLLFATCFYLGAFITKSNKHGILFALLVCIYLVFRINNLTHPLFGVLLVALFLILELLFRYNKR
jgi:hypothetical protein